MTTIITDPLRDGYDFFISDKWGKEYHFKIISFDVPGGKASVAYENAQETDDYYPKKVEILSDFDVDIELAELKLKAKVKKEINHKSLKMSDYGIVQMNNDCMQGIVLAEHDMDISGAFFAVDGKKISAREFSKLLSPYSGFKFRLEIIDPTD